MNLVGNAVEVIKGKGTVTLTTRNQIVDTPIKTASMTIQSGTYIVVGVRDTGSGIEEADLPHIFEPFYSKKVMGRSGTGLGLTIVWNSVQDLNGSIIVDSGPQGTYFELYFPATDNDIVQESVELELDRLKGHGEKVLVVDDLEEQRMIADKMLSDLGYSVHTVDSGKEAVRYMQNNEVSLLLLDMVMDPGINGRETYERIIAIHPGQKTLIMSGYSESEEIEKMRELGVELFIKKPFHFEELATMVKQALK